MGGGFSREERQARGSLGVLQEVCRRAVLTSERSLRCQINYSAGLKRLIKITHGCTDTRFSMFFFFYLFIRVFFPAHVKRPVEELSIRRRVADCVAGEISPSHGRGERSRG